MSLKKPFQFDITYFDERGAHYTDTTVTWEVRESAPGQAYLPDAVAKLRGLRDAGGQGALPGLHYMVAGWNGPILIQQSPGRLPHILLPR